MTFSKKVVSYAVQFFLLCLEVLIALKLRQTLNPKMKKMKLKLKAIILVSMGFSVLMTSCVSNKKFLEMQSELQNDLSLANQQLGKCGEDLSDYMNRLEACNSAKTKLQTDLSASQNSLKLREEQMKDLRLQLEDVKKQRDQQLTQVW